MYVYVYLYIYMKPGSKSKTSGEIYVKLKYEIFLQ